MTDLELCHRAKRAILASELLDQEGRTADSILVMAGLMGMLAGDIAEAVPYAVKKLKI